MSPDLPAERGSSSSSSPDTGGLAPPAIQLPKGGGAIRGMGEKFAANPVTGTGSMSVPLAVSPGRAGFGPQLSLAYDSGAGNGPFGFGWSLSLPAITRKTDQGLPQYRDAEESDVFILSGAEDLVPVLVETGDQWRRDSFTRTLDGADYRIDRYRPRIEGLFARIERWTRLSDGDVRWRSISKDNLTTWYGKTAESRIVDPADPTRIFSWLICEIYDDKGNAIRYGYKAENSQEIQPSLAQDRNRTDDTRSAARYLKRIQYGNRAPRQADEDLSQRNDWLFEVVFDYGEHYTEDDQGQPTGILLEDDQRAWKIRQDPFSTYRAGFEVRTYRLCHRVLMFHHFSDELGIPDYLVRASEFNYAESPIASFITSVTQSSFLRQNDGVYRKRSLPPVEFTYSQAAIQEVVREVDPASLENLPYGLDGAGYQWVDLDGEGLSGILTEQGGAWFYKRNLSANHQVVENSDEYTVARFGPVEVVATRPTADLAGGQAQFMDLAGDGQVDLVQMDGPVRGFHERTDDAGWAPFRAFSAWPNLDTRDPNLRFVDLTGDGHADILLTEDQALTWHASLAEDGFGSAIRLSLPFDEERGPRLVFDDGSQSIYLSDMSGDGLTDLARIRNGEICYWPNLGYGRFGAKVTMDHAPWFDVPELFDQRRIRLSDIDGSGTTDILYLGAKQVDIYRNQAGNGWSANEPLTTFPHTDNLSAVQVVDLLGNGTACLVWSSPLPGDARRQMRYIDLMGAGAQQKPHLLVKTTNNLGAETQVQYAPSTKFYLQDKAAGKSWITKLPFPVHVVEKVTVRDKWRNTTFSSTYSYHHGYFDGSEREFRGFGRVEQVDVESYGKFEQGNAASPFITDDKTLYQPPVKTVTWYHTGASLDRLHILSQFEHEYFPRWFEDLRPDEVNVLGDFQENVLPEPDLEAEVLTAEEWREALRACKGMPLRQEVVELDVDALERGEERPVKLFSTAYHNCHIRLLQPQAFNPHAVFLVAESEAITYHYELDLTQDTVRPDPRIAHTLNLKLDEHANVLQSAAVVYPRLGGFDDSTLPADALAPIRGVQGEPHLAYAETRYTGDFDLADQDNYRLGVPCEALSYELTGIGPEDADDLLTSDRRDNVYFTLAELRRFRLSPVHQTAGEAVPEIPYHELPNQTTPEKRLVEQARMLFFTDDPADPAALKDPLAFGQLGRLGLPYETYKLALTEELLDAVFSDATGHKLDRPVRGATTARQLIGDAGVSGYLSGADLVARFAPLPAAGLAGQYWIRSGIAGLADDAAQHFFLPERYTDPFGNVTRLEYDPRDLFIQSSTDALSNTTHVTQFDFRVLAPREMEDINGNRSEVFFDVLGLTAAMAVKGKGTEGDNLTGFTDILANPAPGELATFFDQADLDEAQARVWLGDATARHIYNFGEVEETLPDGSTVIRWATHPACACGILREQHVSQLAPGAQSPLQAAFEYTDGLGSVVVKKIQAEPEAAGQPLRWIASGKVILNNKGEPVKQFEPYFSSPEIGHRFEEPREEGVTPVIYYDAAGRTVRTEMPDGSFSRIEFSPWHVHTFDQNDTVTEAGNAWFASRTAATATAEDRRAAQLAAEHADTPALTILDSLGRAVISIAHNRVKDAAGPLKDEKFLTFTKLDAEGKPLWIRDARNNLVMQYITPIKPTRAVDETDPSKMEDIPANSVPCYDIAGNLLFQHSMDAGDRWSFSDAAGKPMLGWDSRGHTFRTDYDALHRPIGSFVQGTDPVDPNRVIQFEKVVYGDTPVNGLSDTPQNDQTRNLNLRGKPYQHHDSAGIVTSMGRNPLTGADEAFDFKGNLLRGTRQLAENYKETPDWSQTPAPTLEAELFSSSTRYDALNRPIQICAPHSSQAGHLDVIRPAYNEASLLERVDVGLGLLAEPDSLLDPATATLHAVTGIDYDAKGQRTRIEYNEAGHPVLTEYTYDTDTFRLTRLVTVRPLHPEPDKRRLQDLSYTYDPVGNITHIADHAQPRVFFDNVCIDASNDYRYDALYRLVAATGREHRGQDLQPDWDDSPRMGNPIPDNCTENRHYVETYRYDGVGNILQMIHHLGNNLESPGTTQWNRRYQYRPDNNQLRCTSIPGEAPLPEYSSAPEQYGQRYTYDAHASMITMPHLPLMLSDFHDQLQATAQQVVNTGTPETTHYVYDAGGQRVRKVTDRHNGKRKEERIYLGGFEIYHAFAGNGNDIKLERETLHVIDDKQRIALVETRTQGDDGSPRQLVRFQFGNHLGSASLEMNDQAQVISCEEYYPYGSTSYQVVDQSIKAAAKRYRYTKMERDEENGLNYHAARYYAPWLGRWTSADPIGIDGGSNLFSYCGASPTRYLDPTGHQPSLEEQAKAAFREFLTEQGVRFQEEVQITVNVFGKWVKGRADFLVEKFGGGWEPVEFKGKASSSWTKGQRQYLPALQSEAEFRVTGKFQRGYEGAGGGRVFTKNTITAAQTSFRKLFETNVGIRKKGTNAVTWVTQLWDREGLIRTSAAPPIRGGGGQRGSARLGVMVGIAAVGTGVALLLSSGFNLEAGKELAKGVLMGEAQALAAKAILGEAGGKVFGVFSFFSSMRSDDARFNAEQERIEADQEAEAEINDKAGDYRDTRPEISFTQAREHVISGILAKQQYEKQHQIWNVVLKSMQSADPWNR
jgi:RHS repeat-associated protein